MPRRAARLRSRQRRFALGLTLGFLISLAVAAATQQGYFFGYREKALDLYFWVAGRSRAPEIVLVGIDDAAFQRLKERQPLPRDYLAGVIRGLRKSGARLIALDIDLRRPTDRSQDRALAAAIQGSPDDPAGQVVVARVLRAVRTGGGELRYRPAALFDPALEPASGFPEVSKEEDGFFRRIPIVVPLENGQLFPSLALVVLARLGGLGPAALGRSLAGPEPLILFLPEWEEARGELGGPSPLRFSRDDDWKINFIGPSGSFLTIGSDAVHQIGASPQEVARDNPFRGRIVLVGATFGDSRETFPTPRGLMHGVEVHANILHTLLTRNQIQPVAWGTSLLLQFLLCVGISALFAALRPVWALLISLATAGLVAIALGAWAPAHGSYWFDFLTPILAIRIGGKLHDALERRRIRRSFHQYVGREVADRVYSDDPALAGQRRTVTVMFSDLRDFTTLSESLPAEQVAQLLNEYFPVMVEAVQQHQGIINDFFGDAVMALYGAPADNPDHALDAIRAAFRMRAGLAALNGAWQSRGLPSLRMGIGIHTGTVFAGNVGSRRRMKYTVVGDAVNLAARVEGLNKELDTTLLITGDTYAAVKDRVEVRNCGEIRVKGRQRAVTVYEVTALGDAAAGLEPG